MDDNEEPVVTEGPVKDMSRAKRRHYDYVLKKKRAKNFPDWKDKTPVGVGKLFQTPAACSCPMCGNPRKHFNEFTIQEKKQIEDMHDQIKHLDD